MNKTRLRNPSHWAACILGGLGAAGCNEGVKPNPLPSALAKADPANRPGANGAARGLLEQLGGDEGLRRIADELLPALAKDEQLPAAVRQRLADGNRDALRKQIAQILGHVAAGERKPNLDWLRADDIAVQRRLERLLDEAAERAGVAPVERGELLVAWRKAAAAIQ